MKYGVFFRAPNDQWVLNSTHKTLAEAKRECEYLVGMLGMRAQVFQRDAT